MFQIYKREEVDPDHYTMAGWIGKSTALLEPLAYAIKKHVLKGQAIFADATPVKMLAPGFGKTRTARLWAYVRDERPWNGEAYPGRVVSILARQEGRPTAGTSA